MANKTSQHILSTSANLLGFCLFIITSLHFTNTTESSLIDEFTAFIALLLAVSTIFSFLSLRSTNIAKEMKYENIADYIFFSALVGVIGIILFLVIIFWNK